MEVRVDAGYRLQEFRRFSDVSRKVGFPLFALLRAQRPFPRTIFYYQDKLRRFLEHQGGKTRVEKQDILSFIQALKERRNSPESVNCYLRALRVFFHWAHSEELISTNPMRGIPLQKTPCLLVDVLTPSELQKVLEAIRRTGRNNLKNQAIFLLFLDTRMRPGELCSLTMDDINWNENLVRVSEKTGERLLPISQKTRRAILSYLRVRKVPPGENGLFLSEKGEPSLWMPSGTSFAP